jgi:hypothetical protein
MMLRMHTSRRIVVWRIMGKRRVFVGLMRRMIVRMRSSWIMSRSSMGMMMLVCQVVVGEVVVVALRRSMLCCKL